MTTADGDLQAAWAGWSRALASTLFPAGLGSGQHFAIGQATLVADVANVDPQVASAEVFQLGDAVPAASPGFVPSASLSEAYSLFLRRVASPELDAERATMAAANGTVQTAFNMAIRQGMTPPAGGTLAPAPPLPTSWVPAYVLDAGFRARYEEWQASSAAGRTRGGGVISFSSTLAAASGSGTPVAPVVPVVPDGAMRVMSIASASPAPPPFLRVIAATPAPAAVTRRLALMDASAMAVGASAEATPAPAIVGTGSVSLEVAFTGLGTFMIGPGRWFSNAAIALFSGQLSPSDQRVFFGPNGVLARRVYQIVLGFEPTVTMRFDDAQAFESAKTLLSLPAGTAIGVGPLSFAPGATAGDDVTQTISIGPAASTLPILIGVVSTDVATFPPAA